MSQDIEIEGLKDIEVTVKKGEKGDKGDIHADGVVVIRGNKGDKGDNGKDGVDGKDGKDGEKGDKGETGKNGKNGKDGINGLDGKDGTNGVDGKDGTDGKDGSPDTAEDIVDKLLGIKSPWLKWEAIVGAPIFNRDFNNTNKTWGNGYLRELSDVDLGTSITTGYVLSWNGTKWVAAAQSGGGGGISYGGTVTAGHNNEVLYINSLGNLASDPSMIHLDALSNPATPTTFITNDTVNSGTNAAVYIGTNNDETAAGFRIESILQSDGSNSDLQVTPAQIHMFYNSAVFGQSGFKISEKQFKITNNNITWEWPDTDGASGDVLVTDGSGVLSFAPAGSGSGTVTSVSGSGGTTGLTLTGGPITTSGTLTLGGILASTNGGSGINNAGTFTWGANNIVFTTSGATSLTLPTSGTLATTSQIALPAGSGTEIQYRASSSAFGAVSGSSITANGYMTLAPTASTTGSPTLFTLTGPAHTTLTASVEVIDANWNLARIVQLSTGALTNQRAFQIQAPTYAFVGSSTITNAATFYVSGAPIAGTNATITNNYAMFIGGSNSRIGSTAVGTLNSAVGGIGLEVGGTNNTTGGMNLTIANTSNGTSAFVDLFMQNDLADATGTHFAVLNLNSSTYNDTTFGTLIATPNQLGLYGTDGPTAIGSAKVGGYVLIFTDGTATSNEVARFSKSTFRLTPQVSTSGAPNAFLLTGAAHTGLTASTNTPDVVFGLNRSVQFATGAKTAQHAFQILAPTYTGVAATTITDSATFYIDKAPVASTNITQTNKWSIWVDADDVRFDGNLRFNASGTTTNTNISVVGVENSGINLLGASGISIVTGGATRWSITGTSITGSGSGALILRNDGGAGTATLPTYGCANDTNTGYGFDGGDVSYLTNGGVRTIEMNASQNVGIGVLGASITASLSVRASTTAKASINMASGTAPTSPNGGDMWYDGTHMYGRVNGQSVQLDNAPGEITQTDTVSTTDATVTTLATYTLASGTTTAVDVIVVMRRTGGAGGTAEDGGRIRLQAVYKNVAGTATIIGSITSTPSDFNGASTATLDVTGATVRVRVTGVATNNLNWKSIAKNYTVS